MSSHLFLYKTAEKTEKWLDGWHIEPILVMPFALLSIIGIARSVDFVVLPTTFSVLVMLSPLWLPLFLAASFWKTWMHYIRYQFWFSHEYVLLEVELPPEVQKSLLAMELFLTAMWNAGGETTFIDRIWKGRFRAIWSLEIASNEGRVAYYIHLRKAWRNIIEARLYGQFPQAKVREVDDYTSKVPFNLHDYSLFGLEYALGKPDAYPIKTYIDYNLDKDQDEWLKVDPLTNLLELFGTIGPGEYMWTQIIIKARKRDEWYGFYKKDDSLKVAMKKEINAIMVGAAKRAQEVLKDSDIVEGKLHQLLTDRERGVIEAMERSLAKPVFECGMRSVYLAKKDKFTGINNGALVRLLDPFRSHEFNGINPAVRGLIQFDYPWQDFGEIRQTAERKRIFFRYRNRAYFYVPYDQKPMMFTAEELATMWHFPGSSTKTPGLQRVASRVGLAPNNLPTGQLPS